MDQFPTGLASWLIAGLIAFGIGRAVPRRRVHYLRELGAALAVAITAGITATALNFGGWQVLSPHAVGFAFASSMAAVPLARLLANRRQDPQVVDSAHADAT